MNLRFFSRPVVFVLGVVLLLVIALNSCTASKKMGGCPMTGKMSGYR